MISNFHSLIFLDIAFIINYLYSRNINLIHFGSLNYGFVLEIISVIINVRFVAILFDSNISLAISVFNVDSVKFRRKSYSSNIFIIL